MPATTAQGIIDGAFQTVGVVAQGDSPSTAQSTDALRRLNLMLGGLKLQPLTQGVVSREVFPLTANVGVYTMGPGGDFDTTRPIALEDAAILLNSQGTPASATLARSGYVVTATVASHGGSTGQNVTIHGATQADYNGTFPITVTGVNTFTYIIDASTATTPATGTITASLESNGNSIVEVPRAVLTDDAWAGIRIKSLTSAQFTVVYLNATYAADLATINLWPIPNVATNSLVLYRNQPLTYFASLSAAYSLPDGCEDTLEYNLARRLLTPYGIVDQGIVSDVIDMARTTLATFKRANTKLVDMPTDPALTQDPAGGYNILTGTGGGGGF